MTTHLNFPRDVFTPFPKMARLSRDAYITEKIDGTNAQVYIAEPNVMVPIEDILWEDPDTGNVMLAGSKNRYITPQHDNFGFAAWVTEHASELATLGVGRHFGEWWGSGIQRGYGLPKGEKRFSLFNVDRWNVNNVPACVNVVPILYFGVFSTLAANDALTLLREQGSFAAPGFMNPEGVVVYHTVGRVGFKKTIDHDEKPKSVVH